MKKIILTLPLIALINFISYSQSEMRDLFNPETKIYWMGLDFTSTKFIGFSKEIGSNPILKTREDLRDSMFVLWNDLMLDQSEKFNIQKAFRSSNFEVFFEPVMEANSKTNLEGKIEGAPTNLIKDDIQDIVSRYEIDGKEGIGIVIIVEILNKPEARGTVITAMIDLSSKQLLHYIRGKHVSAGFGLRNYWASVIYREIKEIQKRKYNALKKHFDPRE